MRTNQRNRRGTAFIMLLVSMGVFFIMAAYSLNVAYMQLVRTEMRAATDAAARAGTEALARLDSEAAAVQAAIDVAALNKVNGLPLTLTAADIQLGAASRSENNQWTFESLGTPVNAVRVTAARTTPLMLPGFTGVSSFNPQKTATAAFSETEVCLVVDRSHSMCWDLSGYFGSYPAGTPAAPPAPVIHPPQAVGSRWAALAGGVEEFLETVESDNAMQHVALVTWGSEITLADYEGGLTGRTFSAASLDVPLGTDYPGISTSIANRGNDVMLGATNLSAGIDLGVEQLTGAGTRSYATKVMVVMTDGQWNAGRHPVEAALEAKQAGITIHTVTFLDAANQDDMISVAAATGGQHYHASDAATLEAAFREIARHLSVVLID